MTATSTPWRAFPSWAECASPRSCASRSTELSSHTMAVHGRTSVTR
ncbi:hypothetical protein ACQEVB_16615 [Pseudonocardia sp. CA-107938]